MTDFVVAGSGSRSLRVADRTVQVDAMDRCTAALEVCLAEHGERLVVMSGGAEGFDELIARVALRLNIRLWLALPNRRYLQHYWGRESLLGRDRLAEAQAIVDQAQRVTYVMEQIHDTKALKLNGLHANFWRNLFMVENANDFLVWNPTSKGTAHCVKAIKDAGKWRDGMVLSAEPAIPDQLSLLAP